MGACREAPNRRTDKMEAQPAASPHSLGDGPGIREFGLVILTLFFPLLS